jgi:hypothetical protein
MHTLSGVSMMVMDSKDSVSLPAQLSYPMMISHLKMFALLKTHINNLTNPNPNSNKMDTSHLQEVLLQLPASHKVFLAAQGPASLMDRLQMEDLLEQTRCLDNHHLIRMLCLHIHHLFVQV